MSTSMEIRRTSSGEGTSGSIESAPRLIEREVTVTLFSSEAKYIPIDVGASKFDIRTILCTNSEENTVEVRISDKRLDGDIIYLSLQEPRIYDILNIPSSDKDGGTLLHLFIENRAPKSSVFRVVIKLTNLQ